MDDVSKLSEKNVKGFRASDLFGSGEGTTKKKPNAMKQVKEGGGTSGKNSQLSAKKLGGVT